MRRIEGANFVADEGEFELRDEGSLVAVLTPQKSHRIACSGSR